MKTTERYQVYAWVRRVHGSEWYVRLSRDGIIHGRRHVRLHGKRVTEHKVLGTIQEALAASVPE